MKGLNNGRMKGGEDGRMEGIMEGRKKGQIVKMRGSRGGGRMNRREKIIILLSSDIISQNCL